MNPLRRLPTRKLLAMIAGAFILAGTVTAVAVAVGGGGAIPAAKTLAAAIHDALLGKKIDGVTANIQFTNNLIDSSSIPAATPLLKGATGRLWASNDGHLRLELQSSRGDTQIMVAPGSLTVFDSASNTVYHATLPVPKPTTGAEPAHQPPTLQTITDAINAVMAKVGVAGPVPVNVGGAPAYTVKFTPKHDGGLLGEVQLAFAAENGAPLRFAVYAQNSSSPVLELAATKVSFGAVAPGDLTVKPPADAKTVELGSASASAAPAAAAAKAKAKAKTGHGRVTALPAGTALPFALDAPASLATLPKTGVKLISVGNQPAAIVTYGQHLGAIVVIERKSDAKAPAKPASSSDSSSGLPSVSVKGATGTELATALGTLIKFDRNGISYVVVGSVAPAAAELAARGL